MNTKDFYIQVFNIHSQDLLNDLLEISNISVYKKGALYIKAGEKIQNVPFLIDGLFRGFFMDVNGDEVTDCIGFRIGTTMMSSFTLEGTSNLNIEMLTDSTVLNISSNALMHLLTKYPELLNIYNHLLTQSLEYHHQIKSLLYQCTAMERYEWFLQEYPDIINRINNKYIASFLNMTPVTLSRLRRTIRETSLFYLEQ